MNNLVIYFEISTRGECDLLVFLGLFLFLFLDISDLYVELRVIPKGSFIKCMFWMQESVHLMSAA